MGDPQPGRASPIVAPPATATSLDRSVLPAGCRLHEYVIESALGHGGFGIVYLARDEQLCRQVAIKEFMPGSLASRRDGLSVVVKSERYRKTFDAGLRSFINEARLLARFDHPALVKVYRFWEENGTAYMIMPYYRGHSLKEWLRARDSPLPEAALLRIVGAVLGPLERLHAENVVHRDVAPDNILMLEGGQPLLLDLGSARQIIGDMTQALTAFVKPGYAPVEQYGQGPLMRQGPWTDIYAMAAVMYFAVTGEAPAPSVGRLIRDELRPLQDLAEGRYSPRLLAAIDHALSPRPEDRPATVAEFRRALGIGETDAPGPPTLLDVIELPPVVPAGSSESAAAPPAVRPRRNEDGEVLRHTDRVPAPPGALRGKARAIACGVVIAAVVGGAALAAWLTPPLSDESPVRPIPAAADSAATAAPSSSESGARTAAAMVQDLKPPSADVPLAATVLQQTFGRRSESIGVTAKATRTRLVIGRDALQLTVNSDQSGYLTVLMARSTGELLQLFPDQRQRELRLDPAISARLSSVAAKGPPGVDQVLCVVSARPLGLATRSVAGDDFPHLDLRHAAIDPAAPPSARCGSGAVGCAVTFGAALLEISEIAAPDPQEGRPPVRQRKL